MRDFSSVIKKQLAAVGRKATAVYADGGEEEFFAVVEQTWKRNKTNFEDTAEKAGRLYNEYCEIICPCDFDLKSCGRDTVFIIDGERYELCRCEKVSSFGKTQFYRGIIKVVREADENVFD